MLKTESPGKLALIAVARESDVPLEVGVVGQPPAGPGVEVQRL